MLGRFLSHSILETPCGNQTHAGMCELLVGLPVVTVLGIDDEPSEPLAVHVETKTERPRCRTCGSFAIVKDRPLVHTRATPSGTKGELRVTGE